ANHDRPGGPVSGRRGLHFRPSLVARFPRVADHGHRLRLARLERFHPRHGGVHGLRVPNGGGARRNAGGPGVCLRRGLCSVVARPSGRPVVTEASPATPPAWRQSPPVSSLVAGLQVSPFHWNWNTRPFPPSRAVSKPTSIPTTPSASLSAAPIDRSTPRPPCPTPKSRPATPEGDVLPPPPPGTPPPKTRPATTATPHRSCGSLTISA